MHHLTNMPVTRTKILVPHRLPNLLTRQRLLDLLQDLLDHRLTIVAAPAGYGKTSLLVDWAHQVELPVCWYALDTLDRDFQRFMAHVIASVSQRFPDFGARSAAVLHGAAAAGPNLDHLVTTVVNDAYEHIREHFVLVLDDYHLVAESKMIDDFVCRFVQTVDENCHLVISSRTLLTLPDLPLMVARSQVHGLGFEELAFSGDEIQALLLQNYRLTMPASGAEELAEETEGWITGLLLSTPTAWQGMADRVRVARVSGVGLYEYLAQQVLDQQPVPVRDFLLRTSLLEEFGPELCEVVLGKGEDWKSLIDTVVRSNLFVLPVDDQGNWLRYHHLFRDFLQARLGQERPQEKDRILWQLGAVYAGREEWEKAHDVYQRLGDVAATAGLVELAGPSLVRSGRWETLAEWLDALPADTLASRPALLSLGGIVAVTLGEVERGLSLQKRAEAAFRAAGDLPHLARTLVRQAVDHHLQGNYRAALACAEEALALTKSDETLRAVWAKALKAKGVSLYHLGHLNEAVEWEEQSLAAFTALADEHSVAMLLTDLGMAYVSTGRYSSALTQYDQALSYWREADNVAQQANLLNNMGVLYHLKGDYERAGTLLEEAQDCARRSRYVRLEAYTLCSIGDLYADLDAPDAALDAYRLARQTAQRVQDRFLLFYLDLAEATRARSAGELAQAADLIDSAGRFAQESGSSYEGALHRLAAGQLAAAEGRLSEAITRLEQAAADLDDGGQHVESARAYLYLALACWAEGDQRATLAHLERAFRRTSVLESQHILVAPGRQAKTLLEAVRSAPAVGHQASQLLGQIAWFERDIPVLRRRLRRQLTTVAFAPPRLAIQALGRAQVVLDGKPIAVPEWQSRQIVRDLLFLLLAHPGGLTKEQVGIVFWPDCSPAQLKLRFKNAIYRLRRAVGQDAVLFDGELYRFNWALDYEYDVETFLKKLTLAQATTDPGERAVAYREAVDLYAGPYLPEMAGTWVFPERERLWRAYVAASLNLAECHLETGEYQTTLRYCGSILTEDPALETAHRLAMRAHAALGNRIAVDRQFERCQEALLKEINASPSPRTEALYETLMR